MIAISMFEMEFALELEAILLPTHHTNEDEASSLSFEAWRMLDDLMGRLSRRDCIHFDA